MKMPFSAFARHVRRGQILVLTGLLMIIFIAMAGLAIDVSAAYLTERWERSVADAAFLAGRQSLQKPGTRLFPAPPNRRRLALPRCTCSFQSWTPRPPQQTPTASCPPAARCLGLTVGLRSNSIAQLH